MIRLLIICFIIGLTSSCSQIAVCPPDPFPLFVAELSQSGSEEISESAEPKAFLGVAHRVIDTKEFSQAGVAHGYRIDRVVPGSAADRTGLLRGDIILEFDGLNLDLIAEEDQKSYLSNYIKLAKKPGDTICLKVLRQTSDIKAKGDGETFSLRRRKDLESLLDTQAPDTKIRVTIDNTIRLLSFYAALGERTNLAAEDLPTNRELFPEYEGIITPHTEIMHRLVEHFDLQEQYTDIISRYSEDELWDDGFRLSLFRYVHRDPFKLIPVMEEKTAQLEELVKSLDIAGVLHLSADILDEDIASADGDEFLPGQDEQYVKYLTDLIDHAWELRQKAFAQLSRQELVFLEKELVHLMERFSQSYSIERPDEPDDRSRNEQIMELAHKVDFARLFDSAQVFAKLAQPGWLAGLREALRTGKLWTGEEIKGVSGDILYATSSKAGLVIIGGPGRNVYKIPAAVIIDLGGDDLYTGGAGLVNDKQQISAIIDMAGNDEYLATELFAQGSALLGIGLLFDFAGDDLYVGTAFSQGSAVCGVGILADLEGNDRYYGEEFNQGAAFWGAGVLLDAEGNDQYQSNLFAQGVGGVKALGALLDNGGDDFYFAGGRDKSSYGTSGVFQGSSQGLGIGFRGYASGGIGMLLDGEGDDSFWAGNFSQGTGYFFGLGIIRNFGSGDDTYTASRYGQGASAHSAAGILFDDSGNDTYRGYHVALQGAAWDLGIAALVDVKGDDVYHGSNGFSQAASSHNGMAFFMDDAGIDQYFGDQARAENNDYHGGASLSFFIDGGGDEDVYSSGANNSVTVKDEYGVRADLEDTVQDAAGDPIYFQ